MYFVCHVPTSDLDTCVLTYNSVPKAITYIKASSDRKLISIVDVLGRANKGKKNKPLFYIYDKVQLRRK